MSDRRKYLLLMSAIAVALVGALLLAVPGSPIHKKPTLGLDLQGGLEVVLQAVPQKGHPLTADDMSRSVAIMQNRINKLGVSEPEIRKQGNDQIVIQIAGIHDPAAAAKLIGKTAQLMLFDFENDLYGPSKDLNGNPVATPGLYDLLTQVQKQAAKGAPESYYLFHTKTVKIHTTKKTTVKGKNGKSVTVTKPVTKTKTAHSIVSSANTLKELLRPYGGKVPPNHTVLKVPAHTMVVSCQASTGCLGASVVSPSGTYYYLAQYYPNRTDNPVPEMTGRDLVLSGTRADFGQGGGPIVTLQFTNHGSSQFQKITKEEAQRGQTKFDLAGKQGDYKNYAQHFAIVLDGQLESTPFIDFKQNPDGIPGPNAEIDLGAGGSIGEAKNLALILQTGALPVTFKQIERTDVSATLGKDSLTQAWHAALVGLVVVALFLLILYRFLGLVAVIGLAIYGLFYYAAILLFNVTLTLPGFAGLILTIGVAADANVVVFERIKEEVRAGKSVRAAIAAGYGKGFHTILDANVVTAITALVLFLIAVASVKGFALMLLIGTVISLITAVAATRGLLGLLAGFKWFDNPRFMGAEGQQTAKWLQIDFMKRRNLWFAISGAIVLAGVISLSVRGLNLGIDFKGGTQITFNTHTAYAQGEVAAVAAQDGQKDAIVQGRGTSTDGKYKQWQIRTRSLSGPAQSNLSTDLRTKLGAYASGVKERVVELRPPDRDRRDLGDHRLPRPDRDLHHAEIRREVLDASHHRDAARHHHHRRRLLDRVQGGVGRDRRGRPDGSRLLDLRHDHHLRPRAREHPLDAPPAVRDHHERLAVGDDPQVAGDDVHHAAADHLARDLRRPDSQGLRVRAHRRRHLGRVLLDLHRRAAAHDLEGARAGVRQAEATRPGRRHRHHGRRASRRRKLDVGTAALEASEQALAAEPTPELVDVVTAVPSEPDAQARREKRRQRRRTRPHGRAR